MPSIHSRMPESRPRTRCNEVVFPGQLEPVPRCYGGEGGIRTPDTLSGMPVFKTGAINRSATSPRSAGPLRLYVESSQLKKTQTPKAELCIRRYRNRKREHEAPASDSRAVITSCLRVRRPERSPHKFCAWPRAFLPSGPTRRGFSCRRTQSRLPAIRCRRRRSAPQVRRRG